MRVAIVGTGISGLVVAHHLHGDHEIELFEANDHVGGHVHSVDVEIAGLPRVVDTGFVVFNRETYPNFTQLLRELEIPSIRTDMSFSVCCDETGLEYGSRNADAFFAQRRNLFRPRHYHLLGEIMRVHREAPRLLTGGDEKVALRDWLAGAAFSFTVAWFSSPGGTVATLALGVIQLVLAVNQ